MKINKLILTTFLLFWSCYTFSQTIDVFYESGKNGYIIFGNNKELYPVSVVFDFNVTNLQFSEKADKIFVLPPKAEKFVFGELTAKDPSKGYKFSYNYNTAMGDITLKNFDKSFIYDLPFIKGKSFKINQGYNGLFSHKNENSLDFMIPEGDEILAAREGIIVQIEQRNTKSCSKEECKKYNNYITIMHPDGTFAYYAHIKSNSAKVKLGERVKCGQIIANCGNVGWSNGPHLHFTCFIGGFDKWSTLQTKFKIDRGDKSAILKEGVTYTRNY